MNHSTNKPLSLRQIKVTDPFWKNELELVRNEVIPYQWDALNDKVEGANPSYSMRNFKLAGKIQKEKQEQGDDYVQTTYPTNIFEVLPKSKDQLEDRFYGFVFQDTDFAKWIEAVGYSLTQHPDEQLEQMADEAIDVVCSAQQADGYLDTYYIINNPKDIFTDLAMYHELYCFGHLAEGAVAYYEATGKDKLLKAVEKFADYIDSRIGAEEGKIEGYPGHQIAEMALVRLYEVTGNEKHLRLAKYFIDERGKKPYYFDVEKNRNVKEEDKSLRYHYHQAHLPVREQDEAVGHAVRAVYMYSGMADVARLTDDVELWEACEKLWDNITNKKMYITAGIGGTHLGEAFSFNHDLPNDNAYSETCASIGLAFFARRMLESKVDSKYANVMERAIYNSVLSGMALDGKSFFYVNPLEVLPEACHMDERKRHVKPVRQKWFGCACCPPNIARLVSSIGSYAFTETDDSLYVHLYIGSNIQKKVGSEIADIDISSNFPWEGKVSVKVNQGADKPFTIAFRIPDWCDTYSIKGVEDTEKSIKDGYLYVTRQWAAGDELELDFPMEVKFIEANPMVREDIGKVAVTRGPIVYCIEEADNGKNLHMLRLAEDPKPVITEGTVLEQKVVVITTAGKRKKIEENSSSLYNEYRKSSFEDVSLRWIPYYTWANRGEGEMQVWVRE